MTGVGLFFRCITSTYHKGEACALWCINWTAWSFKSTTPELLVKSMNSLCHAAKATCQLVSMGGCANILSTFIWCVNSINFYSSYSCGFVELKWIHVPIKCKGKSMCLILTKCMLCSIHRLCMMVIRNYTPVEISCDDNISRLNINNEPCNRQTWPMLNIICSSCEV